MHIAKVAPSVMSAGQIQQGDLFDEDPDMADAAAGDNNADSDDVCILSGTTQSSSSVRRRSSGEVCRYVVTMALLTLVNLINYMDRYSVAGDLSASFIPVIIAVILVVIIVMIAFVIETYCTHGHQS